MAYPPPGPSPSFWSGLRGRLRRLAAELSEPFTPLLQRRLRPARIGTARLLFVHYPVIALRALVVGLPRSIWRFARHAPWPLRLLAVVALLAAGAAGGYLLKRERNLRQQQRLTAAWAEFEVAVRTFDLAATRTALENVLRVAPGDPTASRRLAALDSGEANPDDQTLVRVLLNDHLHHNRYQLAARAARQRLAVAPKDWQAHCVLAQQAIRDGHPDEARAQLDALPPPAEVRRELSPGSLLFALTLEHELGRSSKAILAVVIGDALPILKSSVLTRLDDGVKLQLVECYLQCFSALDAHPELASFWVPAAAACARVLANPDASTENLVWLGLLQQRQFPALKELQRRQLVSDADAVALTKDLEARIRHTWERVRGLAPGDPNAYVGLALAALRDRDYAAALKTLEEGLRRCGDRTELLAVQSRLLQLFDPVAGLQQAERVAQDRPEDLPVWRLVAESAVAAGRLDKAVDACAQARRIRPDLEWACKLEAKLRLDQGRPTQALEALAPLLGRTFDDGEVLNLRLRALNASGNAAAIDPLLHELHAQPRSAIVLLHAATVLVEIGRPAPAVELADEILRQRPDAANAWRAKANALRLLARPKVGAAWVKDRARAAVAAYDQLLRRQPNDLAAIGSVVWLYLKALDDPHEAFRRAEPLRDAEKKSELPVELLEVLGAAYLGVGQIEPARQVLERAATLAPPSASCLLSLAQAYFQQARRDDALRCLNQAGVLPRTPPETAELDSLIRLIRGPS